MSATLCDAHVHFFSRGFFEILARQKPGLEVESMGGLLGWEMPPADPAALARRWVDELDRNHVAQAALIASLPGDEASVSAAVTAYPGRFQGFFMANPCQPASADRAVELLNSRKLRVPCLFPAMHQYSMHDAQAVSFLEAVSATRNPVVFIHCGVLSVGVRKKLGLPSLFDLRHSNPIAVHALAMRFPGVRFILPHFGAGYLREALMVADLCPNIYLDTSSSNAWMKYEGLSLDAVFRRAIDVIGPNRLLFGTDSSFFPRGWHAAIFQQQKSALDSIGLSAEAQSAIFGANFLNLLL